MSMEHFKVSDLTAPQLVMVHWLSDAAIPHAEVTGNEAKSLTRLTEVGVVYFGGISYHLTHLGQHVVENTERPVRSGERSSTVEPKAPTPLQMLPPEDDETGESDAPVDAGSLFALKGILAEVNMDKLTDLAEAYGVSIEAALAVAVSNEFDNKLASLRDAVEEV